MVKKFCLLFKHLLLLLNQRKKSPKDLLLFVKRITFKLEVEEKVDVESDGELLVENMNDEARKIMGQSHECGRHDYEI